MDFDSTYNLLCPDLAGIDSDLADFGSTYLQLDLVEVWNFGLKFWSRLEFGNLVSIALNEVISFGNLVWIEG